MIGIIVTTWVISAFVVVIGLTVASETNERFWELSRRALIGLGAAGALMGPLLGIPIAVFALYKASRYIGAGVIEAKRALLPGKPKLAELPEAKVLR